MSQFLLSFTAKVAFSVVLVATVAMQYPAKSRASDGEFQPIKEAEMPSGFPPYTPVGQIELKTYPEHQKATASGVGQFWKLFQHIKKNDVKMTAPVEMDYGDPRAEQVQEGSMSFFYERPSQGSPGKQGSVEVVNVPAMQVASIGCRGVRTDRAVADARKRLMEFLEEHEDRFSIAGPMRVMGYNSPFVPPNRNFFEVQIPVRPATSEEAQTTAVDVTR